MRCGELFGNIGRKSRRGLIYLQSSLICVLFHVFVQQNRPLNTQNAADALQKFNLKKTAVQKALDSLADSGRIAFKEYGKQKIYIARQDQFEIPNSEELSRMKEENAKVQEQINEQKRAISVLEGGTHICMSLILTSFTCTSKKYVI